MLFTKGAYPFAKDNDGNTILDLAKKITVDTKAKVRLNFILEDKMEVNKSCLKRLVDICSIEEASYKMKKQYTTMIKYILTIFVTQFLLQSLVFPFMSNHAIKTTLCVLFILWFFFCMVTWWLGPGKIEQDPSVTLLDLVE